MRDKTRALTRPRLAARECGIEVLAGGNAALRTWHPSHFLQLTPRQSHSTGSNFAKTFFPSGDGLALDVGKMSVPAALEEALGREFNPRGRVWVGDSAQFGIFLAGYFGICIRKAAPWDFCMGGAEEYEHFSEIEPGMCAKGMLRPWG